MRDFVIPLIAVSIVGSFIYSFLGIGSKLTKYVGYVLSLCIVCTVISPVISLFGGIGNIAGNLNLDYGEISNEDNSALDSLMLEKTDLLLRDAISAMLKNKFSLNILTDNITIIYDGDDTQNISIKKITVDTSDSFLIKDLHEMKLYIEDTFMCECEVR